MRQKSSKQTLTFDDVLLLPQKSNVLPKDIDIRTKVTSSSARSKGITLNIPLISADMDTVTEASLAIALARQGGIGIIHKNLSPDLQAEQVDIVKRSESGIIADPTTLPPESLIEEALEAMKRYRISGIPITKNKKLVGILTNRDLRFETNLKAKISHLMTKKNLITAPVGTTIEKAKAILHKHRIEKLPLVDRQRNLKGLITIKDIQKIIDYPQATKDKKGRLRVGASVGVGKEALERTKRLVKAGVDLLVISTSHGHSKGVIETVKKIRQLYPKLTIMAGNVATKEGTRDLIRAGADSIKVGIGPGSICTTRVVAGAGVPQVTAIKECVAAARFKKIPIIADGGVRYSGDISKALAAGAQTVMIGGLFAGTDEAPGELVYYQGKAYKSYRGMGSISALKEGSRDRYAQEAKTHEKLVPQGVEGRVVYKGSLATVIDQLIGGLRAGMGLSGAKDIRDLQRKSRFILVSKAGVKESHPHDIDITEEAPNYPGRL